MNKLTQKQRSFYSTDLTRDKNIRLGIDTSNIHH